MIEMTFHFDSAPGLATDEGLTALFDALTNDARALGAAASVGEDGAYGATFQARGESLEEACVAAIGAWHSAIVTAGHDGSDALGHLEVETPERATEREGAIA